MPRKLVAKVIQLAMEGDTAALKLCLERLIPPIAARDEPVRVPLPKDGTITEQAQAIIQAAGAGNLTPKEASRLLSSQARIIEVDELTRRVEALEKRQRDS